MNGIARLAAGLILASTLSVQAQTAQDVATLARNVEREESVRAVKNLQVSFVQYAQAGQWRQMADLFADKGEAIYGRDSFKSKAAIRAYFLEHFGDGQEGIKPGGLHARFDVVPEVNLSVDGLTAKARWHELGMTGRTDAGADWFGGILENDYVREGGVWKIARLHYYPLWAGPYDTGWRNTAADLKIVPYHYSGEEGSIPIPPPLGAAPALKGSAKANLAALSKRIAAMNDEDKVRNLQNSYGYYVDRKMWDDVADLFTADGAMEVANVGIYDGPKGIRRGLERDGPAGLQHGQLNDRLQLDTKVVIAPDGMSAHVRGFEWGMLGEADKQTAAWSFAVFDNLFVKGADGIWRVREMRIFPVMKADYFQGWGKSRIVDPAPPAALAPDRAVPAADAKDGAVPAFIAPNPVTGQPVRPAVTVAAATPLLKAAPVTPAARDFDLTEATRRLSLSTAYDAVENVISAFCYTIDDHRWSALVALFADKGAREEPFSGFYIGREHIAAAEAAEWGPDPDANNPPPRDMIRSHLRMQPVIHVAPDGRSASIATRLLLFPTYKDRSGPLDAGWYPGDQLVIERGVWKVWSVAIDEQTWSSAGYEGGWTKVKDRTPEQLAHPRPNILITKYPPDIALTALGPREVGYGGGPQPLVEWPMLKPFWFTYKNPVSGRVPEHYQEDCATCAVDPKTSLHNNGW